MSEVDKFYNTSKVGDMISFQYWQNCYADAGLPFPACWAEGLLKPHNHTVSVSDLAFIAGFHGLADLKVGEIKKFRHDGQGCYLVDGSELDADIVIKTTGFLLQQDAQTLTGRENMYSCGIIDKNMTYWAEPLLDGGQFGGVTGKALRTPGSEDDILLKNVEKIKLLPQALQDLFVPRNNPFGSGYTGMMLAGCEFVGWCAQNESAQVQAMEAWGEAKFPMVYLWSTVLSGAQIESSKHVLAKLVQEQ